MSQRTELLAIAAVNALRPFLGRAKSYGLLFINEPSWMARIEEVTALLARYDAALLQEYPNGIPVETLEELENLR